MANPDNGRIITFYSYKGGTGRSMALANVAWILASNGYSVAAVDWDLEAPGLHRYFAPLLPDSGLLATPGLVDLLWDFSLAAMDPSGSRERGWHEPYANVLPYALSVEWDFPDRGGLDFVPAGRQDAAYSKKLTSFDWGSFYDRFGGGAFVEALRARLRAEYDYVLIDSRTGVSDTAGICTIQMPDVLVDCFTMSNQSLDGAAAIARSVISARPAMPLRVLPVPMRVEDGEKEKLEASRDCAHNAFAFCLQDMSLEERELYWGEVEVPYRQFYAYEEVLAVFGDRPKQQGSVLASFERLTKYLTEGVVTQMPPMLEEERRQTLYLFERGRTKSGVFISCSLEDSAWGSWITGLLAAAGLSVSMGAATLEPGESWSPQLAERVSGATLVIAVLSPSYVSSRAALHEWTVANRLSASGRPSLMHVRVAPVDAATPMARHEYLDLVGLSQEAAVTQLLSMVSMSMRGAGQPVELSSSLVPGGLPFPTALNPLRQHSQTNAHFIQRRPD